MIQTEPPNAMDELRKQVGTPNLAEQLLGKKIAAPQVNKPQIIAHRGLLDTQTYENNPCLIENNLRQHSWLHAEIDVWYLRGELRCGHEEDKTYLLMQSFLDCFKSRLLIHCKNIDAFNYFSNVQGFNYFMHDKDPIGITNQGHIVCNYGIYLNNPKAIWHPQSPTPGKCMSLENAKKVYGILTANPLGYYAAYQDNSV